MSKQVQCNRCGYIFDSEDEEFGYCPCCENDQVEIEQTISDETGGMTLEEQIEKIRQIYLLDMNKRPTELQVGDVIKFTYQSDKPSWWSVEYITRHTTHIGDKLEVTFKEIEVEDSIYQPRIIKHEWLIKPKCLFL